MYLQSANIISIPVFLALLVTVVVKNDRCC